MIHDVRSPTMRSISPSTHAVLNAVTSIRGCAQTLIDNGSLPAAIRATLLEVICRQSEVVETWVRQTGVQPATTDQVG